MIELLYYQRLQISKTTFESLPSEHPPHVSAPEPIQGGGGGKRIKYHPLRPIHTSAEIILGPSAANVPLRRAMRWPCVTSWPSRRGHLVVPFFSRSFVFCLFLSAQSLFRFISSRIIVVGAAPTRKTTAGEPRRGPQNTEQTPAAP